MGLALSLGFNFLFQDELHQVFLNHGQLWISDLHSSYPTPLGLDSWILCLFSLDIYGWISCWHYVHPFNLMRAYYMPDTVLDQQYSSEQKRKNAYHHGACILVNSKKENNMHFCSWKGSWNCFGQLIGSRSLTSGLKHLFIDVTLCGALFSCLNHGSTYRERNHEIKPVWNAESSCTRTAALESSQTYNGLNGNKR